MSYHISIGFAECGTSWNHGWYYYQYLDSEKGIRFIYGLRGRDALPFLLKMRETLRGSPAWTKNLIDNPDLTNDDEGFKSGVHDGWAPTIGNALYSLERIIKCAREKPWDKFRGD